MGLAYAGLQPEEFAAIREQLNLGRFLPDWFSQGPLVGLVTFVGVAALLYRAARSSPDTASERAS
jgi:hypothetical protein